MHTYQSQFQAGVEEIAEKEGIPRTSVEEVLTEMADLPKALKPASEHLTDFDPPIYNIWKQQGKTPGLKGK